MSGTLVLVATPIGNLADISYRAVDTLKKVDVIACEDTRHTRKLLNHYEITGVPLIAVHEHNEAEQAQQLIERIQSGETIAYVTDAGTPGISDPGERLVKAATQADLEVTIIPGASASISALAISGLPTERFVFEGFLPRKAGERAALIEQIKDEKRTTILYESPNRLIKTLDELKVACGPSRNVAVVRELTKLFEEVQRGLINEIQDHFEKTGVKGECVIVVEGAPAQRDVTDEEISNEIDRQIQNGLTKRDAIAETASALQVSKNRVYEIGQRKSTN